jgi:hypothetical protein
MSFFSRKKHQNQPSNNVNIIQSPSQALQQVGGTLQQLPQVAKQPSYDKFVFLFISSLLIQLTGILVLELQRFP